MYKGYLRKTKHLDGEITLLQTMEDAATDTNRSKVRDMLGSFLFRRIDDLEIALDIKLRMFGKQPHKKKQ
jgi:ATPase subunit of ABC transporter with duplicated ATPase domains